MKEFTTVILWVTSVLFLPFISIAQDNALLFDGTDDYLSFVSNHPYGGDVTFEAWIYPTTSDGVLTLIDWTDGGDNVTRFQINNGILQLLTDDGVNGGFLNGTGAIVANTWQHVAFTRTGGDFDFYINGVRENVGTPTGESGLASIVTIGSISGSFNFYPGLMDELRIWSTALDETTIQNQMRTGLTGSETDLEAYYVFNETTGTSLPDLTANGYDGTLVNFPASTDPNWQPSDVLTETFTVTNVNDDFAGSLRQTITGANASLADNVRIEFNFVGASSISLVTQLPDITRSMTIDGTTYPVYNFGTETMITLDLSGVTNGDGFNIASPNVTIQGMRIHDADFGIIVNGEAYDNILIEDNIINQNLVTAINIINGDNVTIQGNHIGVAGDGLSNQATSGGAIAVSGSDNLVIGGDRTNGDGNHIAGSAFSSYLVNIQSSDGVTVEGNLIGASTAGVDITTSRGIRTNGADNITIGNLDANRRNFIAGVDDDAAISISNADQVNIINNYVGIGLLDTHTIGNDGVAVEGIAVNGTTNFAIDGNVVSGSGDDGIQIGGTSNTGTITNNLIGVRPDGTTAFGNATYGIAIVSGGVSGLTIGGSGNENVVAYNSLSGIRTGQTSFGTIDIEENAIFCNTVSGIDVSGTPVVPAPVITSISSTEISGTSSVEDNADILIYQSVDGCNDDQGNTFLVREAEAVSGGLWTVSGSFSLNSTYTAVVVDDEADVDAIFGSSEFSAPVSTESFTVTNVGDAGAGSLRQAMIDANASVADQVTITFGIISGGGPWTIPLASALPVITRSMIIDASTQPTWNMDAGLMVEIDGTSAGNVSAFVVQSANVEIYGFHIANMQGNNGSTGAGVYISGETYDNFVIGGPGRGNVIGGGRFGISITSADGGVIQGNRIGIDMVGTTADGNGFNGISLTGSDGTLIGGDSGNGEGNVISSNGLLTSNDYGIEAASSDNLDIFGNLIGTDKDGNNDLGNLRGINISSGCDFAEIGGAGNLRNVISGNNNTAGIIIQSGTNHVIDNNIIGLNSAGTVSVGNGGDGIRLTVDGAGMIFRNNIISANSEDGIDLTGVQSAVLIEDNFIGTNATGVTGAGHGNGQHGIQIQSSNGLDNTSQRIVIRNNVISGNGTNITDNGINFSINNFNVLIQDNLIGVEANGTTALGNLGQGIELSSGTTAVTIGGSGNENTIANSGGAGIQFISVSNSQTNVIDINSIHCNTDGGIIYSIAPDVDRPVIKALSSTAISGTSTAPMNSVVQVFESTDGCLDNQGVNYLGSTTVQADGTWTYSAALNTSLSHSAYVLEDGTGYISEFSAVTLYEITTTADAGAGSFRQAVTDANGSINKVIIDFSLPQANDTINLTSGPLPVLDGNITIDGTTQTGWDFSTGMIPTIKNNCSCASGIETGGGTIEIYGLRIMEFSSDGIYSPILTGSLTVGAAGRGNIIINNGRHGVNRYSATDFIAQGNYVGVEYSGLGAGNNNRGIQIDGSGVGAIIGGSGGGEGNVISGNGSHGIYFNNSDNNEITGNYIGTDHLGTTARANGEDGLFVGSLSDTHIIRDNIFSGNTGEGIYFQGADNMIVQSNKIGVDVNGDPMGNGNSGIYFFGTADSNIIGGLVSQANEIGSNGSYGILQDDAATNANFYSVNSIHDNTLGGISHVAGVNSSIVPPIITAASTTDVSGTGVIGERIHLYLSDGSGQGEVLLDSVDVDGAGDWNISGLSISLTDELVATTTDLTNGTSEFSTPFLALEEFFTTSTADSGPGSLRQAILDANASAANSVTIDFNIGTSAPWVIQPLSQLPTIDNIGSASIIIDATTQPGWAFGDTTTMVHIEGSLAGGSSYGLIVQESNVEIYGLVIDGFFHGIRINTGADGLVIGSPGKGNVIKGLTGWGVISGGVADNITIQSNYIGTSIDGLSPDPNLGSGIGVEGDNILIGGNSEAGEGNVISNNGTSGNEYGIYTGTGDNIEIYGNLIGTDKNGENDFGNLRGIWVLNGASNVTIGGQGTGEGNVISGTFSTYSVRLQSADNIIIDSNIIGLNSAGTTAIPNTGNGIDVEATTGSGTIIRNNTISSSTIDGIVVSDHTSDLIIENNYIGTNAAGTVGGGGLGNLGIGIRLDNASGINSGQPIQIIDNVISGNGNANSDHGIYLDGTSSDLVIQGNKIGVETNGTTALGNTGSGINIRDGVSDVLIGGTIIAERNIIANNQGASASTGYGIYFDDVTPDGVFASTIDIQQNVFSCNVNLGIGYENNQGPVEAPLITSISTTDIGGVSTAANGSTVYVYESTDGCNNNQGVTFLGEATVSAGSWNLSGSFTLPGIFSAFVNSSTEGISPFGSGFLVTSNADNGAGTLREAMTNANMAPTPATITFDLSVTIPADRIISLATQLPTISTPMIIDGSTQNDFNFSAGDIITIDGTALGGSGTGLILASVSEIYGLRVANFPDDGIFVQTSDCVIGGVGKGNVVVNNDNGVGLFLNSTEDIVISYNHIGVEADGTTANGNGGNGISMPNSHDNSQILNNVISGNGQRGINTNTGSNYTIAFNKIGTDISGDLARPNGQAGIQVGGGASFMINNNSISGNTDAGILFINGDAHQIESNLIGVQSDGVTSLANADGLVFSINATNMIIGGSGVENIIARNSASAITFSGSGVLNNHVLENSMFCNGSGIVLANGAHGNILPPEFTTFTNSLIDGTTEPNAEVYLYVGDATCTTDQGEAFVAKTTADGSGNWSFVSPSVSTGDKISVTAYNDPGDGSQGSTSFSSVTLNNALDFDGVDDVVIIPNSASINFGDVDFSVEFWISTTASSDGRIITKHECAVGPGWFVTNTLTGIVNFYVNGSTLSSTSIINDGQWHHVAVTFQGSSNTQTIYIDGAFDASKVGNNGVASTEPLGIGAWANSFCGVGTEPIDAEIDEVRIWSTERNLTQIQNNLYTELAGNEAGLAAYYNFNQGAPEGSNGSETTLIDLTANGNDGTLTNMALTGSTSNWITSEFETPLTPTDLFTTEVSASQIDLSWTDNALNETSYTIERSDGNISSFAFLGTAAADATTYSDNSVSADNGYFYRVIANGVYDSNPSNPKFGGTYTQPANALEFDGVDDQVNLGDVTYMDGLSDITIEAWFNTDVSPYFTASNEHYSIIAKGDMSFAGNNAVGIYFRSTDGGGDLFARVGTGSGTQTASYSSPNINENEWYHVAMSWSSGGNVDLFINGLLVSSSSSTLSGTINDIAESLYLGSSDSGFEQQFDGMIDEVRIWDEVRTPSEILSNMTTSMIGNEANLVGYYRFDQDETTDIVLPDRSINNNNGVWTDSGGGVTTPQWVTSGALDSSVLPNNALDFDGINDVVVIPEDPSIDFGDDDFSAEFWISSSAAGGPTIIGKHTCGFANGWYVQMSSGLLNFYVNASSVASTIPINDGNWHHVAVTFSAATNTKSIYIDGILNASVAGGNNGSANNAALSIGAWSEAACGGPGSGSINAEIDEVRIWNTTRTLTNIQNNLYSELIGNEAGLVAYYNFDQGVPEGSNASETTLVDLTSNGNDGTLPNHALMGTSSNWILSGYEIPFSPTDLFTTEVSATQIDLTWTDNAFNEGSYTIERSVGNNSSFTTLNVAAADATSYSDNTVTADNGYFYRVIANGSEGNSDPSNEKFGSTITAPGNALDFDVSYVSIGQNPLGAGYTGNFTVEAWVNPRDLASHEGTYGAGIIRNHNNESIGDFYISVLPDGRVATSYWSSAGDDPDGFEISTTAIPEDTWSHIAMTYGGANTTLYINGVVEPTSSTNTTTGWDTGFDIGRSWGGAAYHFIGAIDEIKIWSIERSPSEIQGSMLSTLTGAENDLAAYYRFDQGIANGDNQTPSVETLPDRSTNGNDGGLNGFNLIGTTANWVPSGAPVRKNNALDFDGTKDFVFLPTAIGLTNEVASTVEAWIRIDGDPADFQTIYSEETSGGATYYILRTVSNVVQFGIYDGSVWSFSTGTTQLVAGRWYHVAATYQDGVGTKVYLDGNLEDENAEDGRNPLGGAGGRKLGHQGVVNEYFDGAIDEVRLWNKAKDINEIRNESLIDLVGNEGNLLAYYNFDQGIPTANNSGLTTLIDGTANGYDGTLTSFTLDGNNSNWAFSGSLDATPNEPINLTTTEISSISIQLDWTDRSFNETDFIIERSDGDNTNFVPIGTSEADAPDYIDNSVTPGNGYFYRVSAVNATGESGPSNEKFASTLTPPGNALDFDGVDDYVAILDNSDVDFGAGEFTFELWFKPNTLADGNRMLIGKDLPGQRQFGLQYDRNFTGNNKNLSIIFYRDDDSFSGLDSDANAIIDTDWHHIAAVRRVDDFEIYVDGVLIKSGVNILGSVGGAMATSTSPIFIGASNDMTGFVDGQIDEVRLWNTARSQVDIQSNMLNTLAGNESGLVAYYRFDQDEGTDLVVPDRSLNNADGAWNGNGSGTTTPQWPVSEAFNPNEPSDLVTSEIADTQIDLTWTDNSTNETGFTIERSDGNNSSFSTLNSVAANVTSYSDNSVTAGNGYFYRVIANGSSGDSNPSNEKFGSTITEPGNSLDFDGEDDYVDLGDPDFSGYGAFSVEAWIKPAYIPEGPSDETVTLIGKGSTGGVGTTTFALVLEGSAGGGELFALVDNGSSLEVARFDGGSGFDFVADEWRHVAMTWVSGGPITLYIDGGQRAFSGNLSGTLNVVGDNLLLGTSTDINEIGFEGEMDEVRIWSDLRTGIEITTYVNSTMNGDEANLIAYYRFDQDETTDLLLPDRSTNSFNGTWTDGGGGITTPQWVVSDALSADLAAPGPVTQNITVSLDAGGNVTITPDQINNGSTDDQTAPGDLILNLDITDFDCTDIGDNTVTLTVEDLTGKSRNATATVTVVDDMAPTVIIQNINVNLDATGNATIVAGDVDNGSSDNCSVNPGLDVTTFDCTDIGANTVTLTVTDDEGNSANATAMVTVVDNTNPTVVTQDITVSLDATGNATIVAGDVDNGSSDNCSVNLGLDVTTFDCTDVGANTVTLTVTDDEGNSANATATVTVVDNTNPTVVTQDITVSLDATGNATIVAGDVNNGSSDNCSVNLGLDVTTFDCTDVGANTVTLTVTDDEGNSANATATVTVVDNTNPTAVTQDISISLDATGNATIVAGDVDNGSSDNCSTNLSLDVTTFDCTDIGANTVTLTATDDEGNSTNAIATVTIVDDIPPAVVTQDITVLLVAGVATISATDIDDGSSDNCTFSLGLDVTDFTTADLGANTVTLTATDGSGNSANATATVTVEGGNQPPDIFYTFYLLENSPAGELIGTVVATDPENDPLTYTILSGNTDDAFAIGSSSGDITINLSEALDFEVTQLFNLIVQADDGNGGISMVGITINLIDIDEDALGINDLESKISVYPNPATDRLLIEIEGVFSEDFEIQLFTVSGSQVLKESDIRRNRDDRLELDLQDVSPGIYLLKITNQNEVAIKNVLVR
ncbi:MAG: LamG-like jellyroll fold domain-containing protein [Cyclobacteriaceae bacterium]